MTVYVRNLLIGRTATDDITAKYYSWPEPLDELCTNSVGSRHYPGIIIRDFPVEITCFRYLQSAVDARKLKQQLQQNDITYEVRRSVVVSKLKTGNEC